MKVNSLSAPSSPALFLILIFYDLLATVERRLLGSKQRSLDLFHSSGEEETLVTAQKTILALGRGWRESNE